MTVSKRILFIAALALVGAPILAGCATNNTTTTPTSSTTTSSTPVSSTPTSTPVTSTPVITTPSTTPLELKLGVFMPLTGALNTLGPDMRDGALLAVDEINAANLGLHITTDVKDDGTTDSSGDPNKFNQFAGEGVTAVVGPCCSGVTASVLDLAVQNQIVVASPSATSPTLTLDRDNQGFFWRVSPSDAVQGKVDAAIVKNDNNTKVVIIYVNNAYGNGLNKVFTQTFGASNVVTAQAYNEQNTGDFSSQVTAVCQKTADALVIFGYINDGANILKEMQKQSCLSKFKIYGSEGLYSSESSAGLPTKAGQDSSGNWLAAGIKGTNPQSGNLSAFNAKFKAKYGHDPQQYSAESYDGVMYIALAALKAGSVKGDDIQKQMLTIANPPGTSCQAFAECALLVKAGTDIDYKGYAHDFQFDDKHEPKTGIYSEWQVQTDGTTKIIATDLTA